MLTNLPNFDTAWREGQPAFLPVTYRFSLYSPFVCTYNIAVKFKKSLCCLTVNEARDMPQVLVWDIETMPDLRGFAAANALDGKSDDEVRAVMGDKFPKRKRVM